MPDTLTGTQKDIADETAFVSDFATRLEKGETGVDRGRARQERLTTDETGTTEATDGTAATPAKSDTASTGTTTEEGTPGKPGAASDDADEDTTDSAETGDTPAEDDDAGDADEDADGEDDETEDAEDADDAEDRTDAAEPTETELASEARKALAKHGLNMTMDDVPKEARPLVERKLSNMTAAFTRAMMEQRAYRKDEAPLKAELSFIKDHLDLFIFERLQADPDLADRINKRVDEGGTDTGKEALKVVTGKAREDAFKAVQRAVDDTERVNKRADEIETYVQAACRKLNLPFEVVVEAVINRINEKPEDQRNLTDDEVDVLIARQQRIFAKRDGERRADQRKQEIRGRTKDRKVVSPAAKASVGAGTVTPQAKKPPASDDDFVAYMEAKRGTK